MSYKRLKDIVESYTINEESRESFLNSNRFTKLLDNVVANLDSDLVDDKYEYFAENYYDDYEEEAPEQDSEEFKEYLKQSIKDNIVANLQAPEKVGGKLKLYRMLAFKDNYIEHLEKQGNHLGIYWTFYEGSADTYFSARHGNTKFILTGLVSEDAVDWIATAILNTNDNTRDSEYTEDEFRLIKGSPIELVDIKRINDNGNDEELDISNLKDKKFFA